MIFSPHLNTVDFYCYFKFHQLIQDNYYHIIYLCLNFVCYFRKHYSYFKKLFDYYFVFSFFQYFKNNHFDCSFF